MTEGPWRPLDDTRQTRVLQELRARAAPGDAVVIAGVPLLLATVFVAVGTPDRSLVLSHADPTPPTLVTAHFVHRSLAHLGDNLLTYALVVPTTYALALLSAARREFVVTFVGLLLLAPPALSVLKLLAFDRGVALGFSGVTMAFVGVLAVQTGAYLESRPGYDWRGDPAPALFFAGLAFAAARIAPTFRTRVALSGGAGLVACLLLLRSLGSVGFDGTSARVVRSGDVQMGALGLVVLVVGLVAGFSPVPGSGPVVVDTYGHLLGFVIGFAASSVVYHALGRTGRGPVPSPGASGPASTIGDEDHDHDD